MTAATLCSRCGDLIAANSAYESAVVVGYFCSLGCRRHAEADPGRHNPFSSPTRKTGEATEVEDGPAASASVAAMFAARFEKAACRFAGMHPRPDLEVDHLTSAECVTLALQLRRLDSQDAAHARMLSMLVPS